MELSTNWNTLIWLKNKEQFDIIWYLAENNPISALEIIEEYSKNFNTKWKRCYDKKSLEEDILFYTYRKFDRENLLKLYSQLNGSEQIRKINKLIYFAISKYITWREKELIDLINKSDKNILEDCNSDWSNIKNIKFHERWIRIKTALSSSDYERTIYYIDMLNDLRRIIDILQKNSINSKVDTVLNINQKEES